MLRHTAHCFFHFLLPSAAWPPAFPWPQPCGTLLNLREMSRYLTSCGCCWGVSSAASSTIASLLASFSSCCDICYFFSSSCAFSLLLLLLHCSAFLLWWCFRLLFFTTQLSKLFREEQKSKPCDAALQTTTNGKMKKREGSFNTQSSKSKGLFFLWSVWLRGILGCLVPVPVT